MSWTFIIIIGVLIYIAYQLSQLNRSKKHELVLKIAENNEQKIKEFFPHLYLNADEDMKEEIRNFVARSIQENISEINSSSGENGEDFSDYIYLERYKIIHKKIDTEADLKKKERMQSIKEDIVKELRQWDEKLRTMVDSGRVSEWEKDFILWNFLKPINDQFPERYFDLEEYFNSKFKFDD